MIIYRSITYSVYEPKMFSSIFFLFFLSKFDVEKFLKENDFRLCKLKMVDKGCGKETEVVEELKSFTGDTQ